MSSDLDMRLWECERRIVRVGESIDRQIIRLSAVGQGARTLRWYGGAVVGGQRQVGTVTVTIKYVNGNAIPKHDSGTAWTAGAPVLVRTYAPDLSSYTTATHYASATTGTLVLNLTVGSYYLVNTYQLDSTLFLADSISGSLPNGVFQMSNALSRSFNYYQRLDSGYPGTDTPLGCEVWQGNYHFKLGSVRAKISVGGGAETNMTYTAVSGSVTYTATIGGIAYNVKSIDVNEGGYHWHRFGRLSWVEPGEPIPAFAAPNSVDYDENTLTWDTSPGGEVVVKVYADQSA
jgi:hypothetical protein